MTMRLYAQSDEPGQASAITFVRSSTNGTAPKATRPETLGSTEPLAEGVRI